MGRVAQLDLAGTWSIAMADGRHAFYVMAETSVPGAFSENAVDLLPGETVTLIFTPDNPAQLDQAVADLVIRDLHSSSSNKRD